RTVADEVDIAVGFTVEKKLRRACVAQYLAEREVENRSNDQIAFLVERKVPADAAGCGDVRPARGQRTRDLTVGRDEGRIVARAPESAFEIQRKVRAHRKAAAELRHVQRRIVGGAVADTERACR